MRAVGYRVAGPLTAERALEDIEIAEPEPGPRDLLVDVAAVSVNPVDVKLRAAVQPESGHRILGFDAAGVVRAVGGEVSLFRPGDRVYYAGSLDRPGTNAERHVVDERIVGPMPASLSFADAAALPLTAITAWELLFDGFRLAEGGGAGESLLVVGGAGGVGSVLIQLARQLTRLDVVATASRPESRDWCLDMGAHAVIDHARPLAPQLAETGRTPRYVAGLSGTDRHFGAIVDLIAPRGTIGIIDDPAGLDIGLIKPKALTFHWAFMFARPLHRTPDMIAQHALLERVRSLVDDGRLRSTATRHEGPIDAAALRRAHAVVESGRSIGKTVLDGFSGP